MKPIFRQYRYALIMLYMGLPFIQHATAQQVLFDFDAAPLYSSLPVSQTVNGITAQFSATGSGFSIQNANTMGFTPAGFSGRCIYPNSVFLADLLIKFDSTLNDFSIMYACQELGCDDAATMRVTAYRNGNYVGTNTKTAANPGTWPVDTLRCSFVQVFDSVVVHYDHRPPTCQDYGVIFLADNMKVTAFTIVPVQLQYFTGEAKGNTAILEWKSAEELNLGSYIVQCATDGSSFHDIALIKPQGTDHTYGYVQQNNSGTVYYRLKMTDRNGTYKYSAIIKLLCKNTNQPVVIPNPAHDVIRLYSGNAKDTKIIQLFSASGLLLQTIRNYADGQPITVTGLYPGIYVLKVTSIKDGTFVIQRFLKY